MRVDTIWFVALAIHGLSTLAAWFDILLHYRRPTAAVAWLFTVATVPLVGPAVYLAFGVYRGTHRIRRHRRRAGVVRATRDPREDRAETISGDAKSTLFREP